MQYRHVPEEGRGFAMAHTSPAIGEFCRWLKQWEDIWGLSYSNPEPLTHFHVRNSALDGKLQQRASQLLPSTQIGKGSSETLYLITVFMDCKQ